LAVKSESQSAVANRLWELAKSDPINAPLLRQAYEVIEVQRHLLGTVLNNACSIGYEGSTTEGALHFFQELADEGKRIISVKKQTQNLKVAKSKLNEAMSILQKF